MERTSFVFHAEWRDSVKKLPKDIRLEVYEAIIEYGISGTTSGALKPVAEALFSVFVARLEADRIKWSETVKRRQEAGSRGGLAKASKCYQMLANASKCYQKVANATLYIDNCSSSNVELIKEKEDKSSSKKVEAEAKKVKYGERVAMLKEEHAKLCETYGEQFVAEQIAKADDWLLANGRTMKDYAAFMRNWLKRNMAQTRINANASRPVSRNLGSCPTPDLAKSTEDLIRRGLLKPPRSHKTTPVCPSNLKDDNLLEPAF